jgi:hypothetical protein
MHSNQIIIHLFLEGAESVHPTMGFSRGEFTVNKCKIIAYDLGGAERIRDIWKIYYAEVGFT